jgi:hypothetical protein
MRVGVAVQAAVHHDRGGHRAAVAIAERSLDEIAEQAAEPGVLMRRRTIEMREVIHADGPPAASPRLDPGA